MQEDFAQKFDDQTVESRDFTIAIQDLPITYKQYHDIVLMKFAIWDEIQEGIKLAKSQGILKEDLDSTILQINFSHKQNHLALKKKELMLASD